MPDNGSGFTTLYQQLQYLARQARPGARLTIWHEAGHLYGNVSYITPAKIRAAHARVRQACAGTGVRYGVIIYGTIAQMARWIPYPPVAMDWYGIDLYDNTQSNNGGSFRNPDGTISQARISAYLSEYRALARQRSELKNPQVDVCECNAPESRKEYRGDFFSKIAFWLSGNGGGRLQVFFKCGGVDGGCWLPDDQPTISSLNQIADTCG